jgi:ABC-type uncharacterized transport system substrate-binding protein
MQMHRRTFLVGASAMITAVPRVDAQQPPRVWRVGYLSLAPSEADEHWVAAFRQALRALGYIEGDNVIFDQRHAAQQPERLPELAADLIRLKVDVVVTYGGPSTLAIQKVDTTIPIVMAVHADPVGTGLVASLARPGGQVTGLADSHADLIPKRLDLLKAIAPSASRAAILFNPETAHAVRQLKSAQTAAPALGLSMVAVEVRRPADIDPAFTRLSAARVGAVVIVPDATWWSSQEKRVADLIIKHRLPSISTTRESAQAGILMTYGTNFSDLWRRAATYVDKILKGARPADLPIEQPTRFELVLNRRTAKVLGITIPASLLLSADLVLD